MVHLRSYLDYTIESSKTPEDAYLILKSVTEHRKGVWNSTHPEFIGEVYSTNFKFIRNNISYRNSFQPVITGTIIPKNDKTIIQIKMRLHSFTQFFEIVWFGFIFLFFIIGMLHFFITDFQDWGLLIHSTIMIAGGLLISKGGFYLQARSDLKKLKELLETPTIYGL